MRYMKNVVLRVSLFLFLLSAGWPVLMWANPVDPADARRVAVNFYARRADIPLRSDANMEAQLVYTATFSSGRSGNDENAFYVFNIADGFVMVAADDRVQPVLAYSLDDSFYTEGMPANIRFFMGEYVREIAQILSDPLLDNSLETEWRAALSLNAGLNRNVTVISPLLTTRWNQNSYYNNMCPADTAGPNDHTYVGCVATAMGQIMRYWQTHVWKREWRCSTTRSKNSTQECSCTQGSDYVGRRNCCSSWWLGFIKRTNCKTSS